MRILVVACLASFVFGMFGYVLVVFWLVPVRGYRRLKRRIARDLRRLPLDPAGRPLAPAQWPATLKGALRRHAVALAARHDEQLPQWYRSMLKGRGEAPLAASAHLAKLANARDPGHAAERLRGVRQQLKIKDR